MTRPREPFRRAVVTGGAGFLGSHLCTALRAAGTEVVCLDSFLTGTPANVAHLTDDPGFRLLRCDLTDYVHVPGPVDVVLHLASPASPVDYLQLPIQTLKVGALGTLHALGLAKDKGARFLLASTSEVYGDPQVHPQPESYWGHVNPIGPRGVYDEAKRYAEALTTAYRGAEGLDAAIVRIFNPSGATVAQQALRLARDGRHEPAGVNAVVATDYLRAGPRWYSAVLPHMFAYDTAAAVARLPGPVVVARGERDPVASREWIRRLADLAPSGTAREVPRAGHVAMATHAPLVARWVREDPS